MASEGRQPVSMMSRTQSAATPGYSARASLIAANSDWLKNRSRPSSRLRSMPLQGLPRTALRQGSVSPALGTSDSENIFDATVRMRFARTGAACRRDRSTR